MKSKIISFWSPVGRSGSSTNAALYISYLSKVMNEMDKAVLFSLNVGVDSTDYIDNISVKEGFKKLKLLYENSEINSKEDIYVYTHKIAENIDVLGTDKKAEEITTENIKLMIEILSKAYDYIILDIPSGGTDYQGILDIIYYSTVSVVCMPQDKYICKAHSDNSIISSDVKNIILISDYDDKKAVKKSDIEAIMQRDIHILSHDVKINKSCDERDVYSYVNSKKANNVELDKLYRELERLINIDNLSITYELKPKLNSNKKAVEKNVYKGDDEFTKIVKEYKFIKAKNNIGIFNLSQGAGATFLTLNLASFLKEQKLNVVVAEIPSKSKKRDIFNIINCDDCYNELPYIVDGIKYYINTHELNNFKDEGIIDYINKINRENNSINLYDLSCYDPLDNNINYLMNLLDCCIIVIEPLPFKLLQSDNLYYMMINELNNKGVETIHVANKFIDDLSKKHIENYLNCKVVSCVPFIKPEIIYAAYYSSEIAYKIEKNEQLKNSLKKIIDKANIAIYLEEKEKNIFNKFNIFRKKKGI